MMDPVTRFKLKSAALTMGTGFVAGSTAVAVSSLLQTGSFGSSSRKAALASGAFMAMIFGLGSFIRYHNFAFLLLLLQGSALKKIEDPRIAHQAITT
jgi:hypothetical protein